VEEKGRALDTFVGEAYRVLKSVVGRVKRFESTGNSGDLGVTPEKVRKMRDSTKYKTGTGRNVLGVRILLEDWIHGLEIGHVMQLNPMLASELQVPQSSSL
jgi:hypothetical protein